MEKAVRLFKAAILNEIKASAYYAQAAEVTTNDVSRMLLLELANQEDDHARVLIAKTRGTPLAHKFDAEAYLRELERDPGGSLGASENQALANADPRTILEMAMRMEGEARDNLRDMADSVSDPALRKYCLDLSAEEQAHYSSLERTLNSLDMTDEERSPL
ncbi:MAG: ferritin family protein [Magnetococcales bacterium]|nr:ferritin family protein [Magnetococcales bacterium]